jgi:hypothetical protein
LFEFARSEKKSVRFGATRVMNRVCIANSTQPRVAREESNGEAPMNESVMHDDVCEAERCHASTEPDRRRGCQTV